MFGFLSQIDVSKLLCRSLLGLATGMVILVSASSTFAQDYKVGDEVEFERLGRKYKGTVSELLASGRIVKIQYQDGPKTVTYAPPVSRIRKVGASSSSPAAGNSSSKKAMPAKSGGGFGKADGMRFWSDASGKFKVKAKLLERVADKVRLETEDGRLVTVPVERLSDFDKTYLQNMKAPANENPFAGGEKIGKGGTTGGGETSGGVANNSGIAMNTVSPNPTGGKRIILLSGGNWGVTPDVEVVASDVTPQPVVQADGGFEKPFFDKPGNFIVSPDENVAAVTITNAFGGDRTAVQFFDLNAGKQLSNVGIPIKEASLVGVIMDPPTFATTRKEWFKDKGRVDFWDGSDGLKHVIGWEGNYKSAKLVNDDQLLTIDHKGQAVLWDWRNAKSIYYFDSQAHVMPALSANQKQMAVGVANGIMIVDVATGKPLGTLGTKDRVTMLAFSRDGEKLASIQNGQLAIYNLTDGELIDKFTVGGISPVNPSLAWADEENILVNGSALVNYRLRVPVWEYKLKGGKMPLRGGRGGRFWYSVKGSGGKGVLIPMKIPHQDVIDIAGQYDPEDFLVIKPGMSVAIKMNLPFGQADQQKIYDSLASKLKANGCEVDPNSSVVLNCFTEKGKTQSREYQSRGGFGRPIGGGGTQKVTFTPTLCYMQLSKGRDVLWKRSVSSGPGFMMFLGEGESIQQAANKQSKPNPGFYTAAQIPKYYAKLPGGKKALGTSELTENGIN